MGRKAKLRQQRKTKTREPLVLRSFPVRAVYSGGGEDEGKIIIPSCSVEDVFKEFGLGMYEDPTIHWHSLVTALEPFPDGILMITPGYDDDNVFDLELGVIDLPTMLDIARTTGGEPLANNYQSVLQQVRKRNVEGLHCLPILFMSAPILRAEHYVCPDNYEVKFYGVSKPSSVKPLPIKTR